MTELSWTRDWPSYWPSSRWDAQTLTVQQRDAEIAFKQALIDKLTHEMAVLKRLKFAATRERFASTLVPEQKSLLSASAH